MTPRASMLRAAMGAILLSAVAPSPPAAGAPAAGPIRARHLLGQTSPYLQEHLDNPVDWYPWGEEALEKARAGNKPIFLSIGYSACHWCHVMERETFSDEGIAALLNDVFVSIKVDREERPDLDAVYMSAVLMMTGRGGWPMTVFLTPDRRPFFGGTYFPNDRFRELLLAVGQAWKERRAEVEAAAGRIAAAVAAREAVEVPASSPDLQAGRIRNAMPALAARFDAAHGGFGTAPKFPPYGALALLLEMHRRSGDREALDMAVRTLDAMARGGIYDQLGGGFHRYSTDARWFAPHFEKMLYDNALLVPLYLRAWRQTGREEFRRVAEETLAWVRREMTEPGGGFHATLDADSEGEEGRFYLWSDTEARRALGKDADLVLGYFGATAAGNFEGGRNILHVPVPPERFARDRGLDEAALRRRVDAGRSALLRARDRRVRPHRDDKILSGWNGLMISAFAAAHAATGDPAYRLAAAGAARAVLDRPGGSDGMRVSWRDGRAGPPAFLDDYAFLARGLLDLHEATGEREWLEQAARLVRATGRFRDADGGGYFLAGPERDDLIVRTMRLEDEAIPSGNAVLAECQVRLAERLGDAPLREAALGILRLAAPGMASDPASHATLILAAARLHEPAPVLRAASRGTSIAGAVLAEERDAGGGAEAIAAAAASTTASGGPAAGPGEKVIRGTIVGRPNLQRVVESAFVVPGLPVRPGQALTLSLRMDLAKGWHVNSARPTLDYLIATRIEFPDQGVARVDEIAYPPGHLVTLKFADEKLSVYEGSATIRATIRPLPEGPPGPREIRARLVYQACNDTTCLPPETVEFRLPIRVEGEAVPLPPLPASGAGSGAADGGGAAGGDAPGAGASGGAGAAAGGPGADEAGRLAGLVREGRWGLLLGVVFLGGLALNLTPCVYPILPVTIGFFSSQSGGTWGRRTLLPTLYVLGMALTYSALGVTAGLSGGLFGAALQSVWVVGGLVVLFVAMAFWLFGLYELRLPGALTALGSGRRGAAGALVMGLTMGLVAAPCIGPFVVGLLAFVSAAGDPVLGFWLFFVMAIGMGLPNLVLGIFSGAVAALPRSGAWLIYAKKVMGIAMLAVALYFLQPFLSDRVLGWIALVFAIAAGVYLAFLERTRGRTRAFQAARLATGLAVVVAGSWVSLPLVQARPALVWEPYSHEAFASPDGRGRPVIIDFSAEWCLPCKELERFTFTDPRVIEEGARFRLLKADLTQFESEHVRHMKERFQVVGVPTLVFLDSGGKEREDLRLYGFEPSEAFLRRLQQVR